MLNYDFFDDFYRFNRELNRVLRTGSTNRWVRGWPETNIYENKNEFVVVAKVPGLEKSDISITFQDNALRLSGEKKGDGNEKAKYHLKERKTGKFERNFILNEKVDVDKAMAEVKNGLLLVKIPKSPETQPKSITIS